MPSDLAHRIEQALRDVCDQRSFVQRLLVDALGWPIDESAVEVNDIAYYWREEELRASGLEKDLVDGQIWQIQPLAAEQPWGVFLLEFKRPGAFETGRGMVGPLRKVLRGLVPSWRKAPAAKSWNREHLLFFCTHNYEQYRVGYFKSPPNKTTAAPLAAFGWGHGIPARTACEFNLPALAWPDDLAPEAWVAQWASAFDVEKVTREFYEELANWYFWALGKVEFPKDAPKDAEGRDALSLIRLITRLIFCWFIKEKGLIPPALFDPQQAPALLADAGPKKSTYYQAILQNLFFATLNQEMGQREFRKEGQNFMAHNLYRYRKLLKDPGQALQLFDTIPFMNGGLFECLDKHLGTKERPRYLRLDGFSDRDDNQLSVPNELFFAPEQTVDLSHDYGEARYRSARVRGLIHTLTRYKFTLAENTPLEQEVALDPELLGKVFENLLASFNPETGATARKATGSFYTPRPIVDYMIDESLVASFKSKFETAFPQAADLEPRLRHLLAYNDEPHQFSPAEVDALIHIIDHVKILDPACGSGAFPMGVLHKLVFALAKLDPRNERWKARQVAKAEELTDATVREKTLADIEEAFAANELDYGRKLYLIENCIYGVDIQPIAVQISKLRCFISLIVDQKKNEGTENLGIRPLPNLETNFVAANTLVAIDRPRQKTLRNPQIDAKEAQLRRVRDRHFSARTPGTKAKCREDDARLRREIAELLEETGWDHATARQLASWDPYDQNASADFFDAEWMFGIPVGKIRVPGKGKRTLAGRFSFVNELPGQMELVEAGEIDSGFDIVIGNPPYVRIQTLKQQDPELADYYKEHYQAAKKGNYDVYVVFVEAGLNLLKSDGELAYILPHKFFNAQYGEPLRALIAKGRHLRHVVHFGDQQVFPGATNYVCLMFLAKRGPDRCRWSRVDDLAAWLTHLRGPEDRISADALGAREWNFAGSAADALLAKLQRSGPRLLDVPAEMSRGSSTGDDEVFMVRADGDAVERHILRIPVFATDFQRYWFRPNSMWRVIFPYQRVDGSFRLIPEPQLRSDFPIAYRYLRSHKEKLEQRKQTGAWYGFSAPRNLDLHGKAQFLVPLLAATGSFAPLGANDALRLCPMASGGFTVSVAPGDFRRPEYVLGLLNSRALFWMLLRTSNLFRDGWITCTKQYFGELPIRDIDTSDVNERAHHDAIVELVRRVVSEKHRDPSADTSVYERDIDDRVYRLYRLTDDEKKIIEESTAANCAEHGHAHAAPPAAETPPFP